MTAMSADHPKGALALRARGLTIRTKLTLVYTALVLGVGVLMATVVYLAMRYIPTYDLTPSGQPRSIEVRKTASGAAIGLVTITSESDILQTLLITSIIALLISGSIGAVIGWIITGRLLAPLRSIHAATRNVANGDLSYRIGLAGPDDELKELGETFNSMLERLETSFLAHQRFAADASHELRTPLATTQAMLDIAIAEPATQDLAELARKLRLTNQRSIDLVDALLDLADIAQSPPASETIDLGEITLEAWSSVRNEARSRAIRVEIVAPSTEIQGDGTLLRQLTVNLLHNAIRHNRPNGTARVVVADGTDATTLSVTNSGPAVATENLPLLSGPFFRGAGRSTPRDGDRGHGLGLAIADAIAKAHHGSLELTANHAGGLTAVLTIPHPAQ